jgi:hypothetical protein
MTASKASWHPAVTYGGIDDANGEISSMSGAEFGAENLLRPLSQIRLGLK